MTYQSAFTETEWRTLQFAPIWVFGAVAAADGKVEKQEIEALAKEIGEAPLFKNAFTREVLLSVATDFATIMRLYQADPRNFLAGLGELAVILSKKTTPEDALGFKRVLFGIAVKVANAAGPMFGSKISKEEQVALALVATQLQVTLDQLMG